MQLYKISHSYYIHNAQLSVVNQCKYLGILIQSDLKWNSHVNYVTAKANQTLATYVEKKYQTSTTKD